MDYIITRWTRSRKGCAAMKKEMAETLVRAGPGTPMGNLMRRYWVPILLSSEVAEPDGPPVRAQILSEKLLAFRNTEGKVGLVDEFCSHRGASLYFGRNEENGIRCAYHGLKFAIDGQCVDVPSAPQACKHMGIKGYPCIERAGMVWAYMGPKGKEPAPPAVKWCNLPPTLIDRRAQKEKRAYSGVFGIAMQDASLQESMGPIQDHANEKLLPTDRAIVMARRMLYEAATAMGQGAEPPALAGDAQRVRAAGVLLDRDVKPQEWAKIHLTAGLDQPVYSI